MRNRRKLSFITMHILIRISLILKAGVAKNPVLELMNGVYLLLHVVAFPCEDEAALGKEPIWAQLFKASLA